MLTHVERLIKPLLVDGVGGHIPLTHKGRLTCLPSANNMNRAYFAKDLPINLISLGYLQRCGAFYSPDPARPTTHFLIRLNPDGPILATVQLSRNNMLPVDFNSLLASTHHLQPSAFLAHHSAEQLRRADDANQLHYLRHHPSDDVLCADLSSGKIPWSTLTSSDVRLSRSLRGPCPHCIAGKLTNPPAPTSHSAPAESPGAVISFDIHQLPEPSPGGFTHALHAVDEFSGKFDVIGCLNKTTLQISRAIRSLICEYNSDGHRVKCLHGDSERINSSLQGIISLLGAKLQLSLPGEHQHKVERYERTLVERSLSTLASLPYYLPAKYTLPLHKSVSASMNNSICTQSAPLTPNEVVGRAKPTRAPLEFGRSSLVIQHEDKRQAIANRHHIPMKHVDKAELGVSMGPDLLSKHTMFVLANGLIVPRRIRHPLPNSFVPFNWSRKEYHIDVNTAQPEISPSSLHNTLSDNTVVQLPGIPLATAIQSMNESIPEVLPLTTLEAIRQHTPDPSFIEMTQPSPPQTSISQPSLSQSALPQSSPPLTQTTELNPITVEQTDYPLIQSTTPVKPPPTQQDKTIASPSPIKLPIKLAAPKPPLLDRQSLKRTSKPVYNNDLYFLSAAISRKVAAIKQASARNRLHFISSRNQLNNRATEIEPTPPQRHRAEISINKAINTLGAITTTAGIAKELTKIFTTYQALKPIALSDIEPDAVYLRSQILMKLKLNGQVTARLAIDGSKQPLDTYKETFAGTSCTTNRCFIISSSLADAAHRRVLHKLQVGDFDIPGAFLQNRLPRSATGFKQLWTMLPKDIPKVNLPCNPETNQPTRLAEIVGSVYGIKQANNIFDKDFTALLSTNGYHPTDEDPHTFTKRCPLDPSDYLHVNVHVDDGQYAGTSDHLVQELQSILRKRYGADVPFNPVSTGICGVRLTRHSNNNITLDMGNHIIKSLLPKCGMDKVPPALTPSLPGFFDPPLDTTPTDSKEFQSANGCLIHLLPIRYDIRKEVIHLCSRNQSPTKSDRTKQIQVLRYLKGCPLLGITFSADPAHFPSGVTITGSSDSSHACHTADGKSHSAHIISIGFNNAPFSTYSSAEPANISVSPCESEYVALSRLSLNVIFFRKFATSLGYPQNTPSILKQDNKSSISLVTTPELPRRSRHILQRHHIIRSLYLANQILPVFEGTHDLIPDGLTKTLGPSAFMYFRSKLMRSTQLPSLISTPPS